MQPVVIANLRPLKAGVNGLGQASKPAQASQRRIAVIRGRQVPLVGGLRRSKLGQNSNLFTARAYDPDEYETETTGYDSDDYEGLDIAAAAPRMASQTSDATIKPSISYDQELRPSKQQGFTLDEYQQKSAQAKTAISSGFNIMLLLGAAIDRFVSRMQASILAAGAMALRVLASFTKTGRRQLSTARLQASESFKQSSAGKKIEQWSKSTEGFKQELPDDMWGKLLWLWDRPPVQRIRLTISMANLSIRLPALLALVATQVGLLASQVSLPMLAPLLLGTGMLARSIKSNASFLFPRIGLLVVVFWLLWFVNSVVQNTANYLRRQRAIDNRLAGSIITVSECTALLVALVVVLSMLGVNVSALLLPAGIAVAVAAKDLSHNFLAGFFLFVVQPFKLGDRVAVSSSAPGAPGSMAGSWFEGVCEKVDLRYTMIRQGKRRLMVPNSAFLTREFMVLEDAPAGSEVHNPPPSAPGQANAYQEYLTNDYRHVWQYVNGPPVHQELLQHPGPPQGQRQGERGPGDHPGQHQPQQQQRVDQIQPAGQVNGSAGGVSPPQQQQQPPQQPPPVVDRGSGSSTPGSPYVQVGAGGGYATPPPTYQQPPPNGGYYPYSSSPEGPYPDGLPSSYWQQQQQHAARGYMNGGVHHQGSGQPPLPYQPPESMWRPGPTNNQQYP